MAAFKYFQVNNSRDVFIQKDLEVFYNLKAQILLAGFL